MFSEIKSVIVIIILFSAIGFCAGFFIKGRGTEKRTAELLDRIHNLERSNYSLLLDVSRSAESLDRTLKSAAESAQFIDDGLTKLEESSHSLDEIKRRLDDINQRFGKTIESIKVEK